MQVFRSLLAASGLGGYNTGAVTFDGTNDYMTLYSAMTGLANGKDMTLSFWINMAAGTDGTAYGIFNNFPATNRGYITERRTDNTIRWYGSNTAAGTSTEFRSVATITASSGWTHIMASHQLSTTTTHFYVDGVSSISVQTAVDANVDFVSTSNQHEVGSVRLGLQRLKGDLSDLWWDDSYVDLSSLANREKFIKSGKPVDLGTDGSEPTGAAPLVYLHHETGAAATDFATNRGSAQDYTIVGALTEATTSPSD
jgi:hypothetical protein